MTDIPGNKGLGYAEEMLVYGFSLEPDNCHQCKDGHYRAHGIVLSNPLEQKVMFTCDTCGHYYGEPVVPDMDSAGGQGGAAHPNPDPPEESP